MEFIETGVFTRKMGIVEISVFAILFLYVAIKGEKKEKIVAVIGMIVLFLLSAFRAEKVGIDIALYNNKYEEYSMYNFSTLKQLLSLDGTKDPTYYYTGWFFSRLFKDPQWWLGFIALLYSISVGKLIYKESKQVAISIVMLVSLSFYYFSLTGLRQTVAMSILLFAYPFLQQRRFIPFAIIVFISSRYHLSAIAFFAVYPIANKKLGIYHVIIATVALIVFYAFRGWLLQFLNNVLGAERFEGYTSGNASQLTMAGFAIQTACFIFGLYYYKRMIAEDERYLVLYNLSFIGWVFQLFSSFIAEFFRVSMMFSIFNIILIANAASMEKESRSRSILQMVVIIIFALYMIKDGGIRYEFFWK